tara:strand:- start:94 stop:288 length:195 start_codon:yes stop_codon:yes gene_type:complete
MTPQAILIQELITWGAKLLFDAVTSEDNNLDASAAKSFSKNAISEISEEAQKLIQENLPKHLKL